MSSAPFCAFRLRPSGCAVQAKGRFDLQPQGRAKSAPGEGCAADPARSTAAQTNTPVSEPRVPAPGTARPVSGRRQSAGDTLVGMQDHDIGPDQRVARQPPRRGAQTDPPDA